MKYVVDIAFANPNHQSVSEITKSLSDRGAVISTNTATREAYCKGYDPTTSLILKLAAIALPTLATLIAPLIPQFLEYIRHGNSFSPSMPRGFLKISDETALNEWLQALSRNEGFRGPQAQQQ